MPKRKTAKKAKRKPVKKVSEKKTATRKAATKKRKPKVKAAQSKSSRSKLTPKEQAGLFNRNSYWKAFKELQARADKAWNEFHLSVKKKADPTVIQRHRNELLLILGECNYMAQECERLEKSKKLKKA